MYVVYLITLTTVNPNDKQNCEGKPKDQAKFHFVSAKYKKEIISTLVSKYYSIGNVLRFQLKYLFNMVWNMFCCAVTMDPLRQSRT